MAIAWKSVAITVALAAAASGVGAWAGASWVLKEQNPPSLHAIVHNQLNLSAEQSAQIKAIEARFVGERLRLEAEVQAANRELATAIQQSQGDSALVQPAVAHFHDAMGELQQATIAHIFEMRAVLSEAQAETFDESVVKALTADAQ